MRKRKTGAIFILIAVGMLAVLSGCDSGNGKIRASGTIEAPPVMISSKVSGDVLEIRADEGARVKKDDILVVIHNRIVALKLEQAQKGLALAQIELELVSEGARIEDIEQAGAVLVQAENNFKVAEDDERRMAALFESGSITQKQRDDAQARAAITRAQLDAARQGLSKVKNFARPEEIRAALIRRDVAQIAVDLAREEESFLTVRSPADGIVTHRLVEEGELVFQGSSLLAVTDLSRVELTIYITERELALVSVGRTAAVFIDMYPDRAIAGTVTWISPEAEFTPKNVQTREDRVKLVFAVKITIPNPDEILKPGMSADAELAVSPGTT